MDLNFPEEIRAAGLVLQRAQPLSDLAERLFAEVQLSRETLRPWLPWLDKTQTLADEFAYLTHHCQANWTAQKGFAYALVVPDRQAVIGMIDLMDLDPKNKSGEIGFWLTQTATGHGFMHRAVLALEQVAFQAGLNRLMIRNDTRNSRSVHVCQRAGYHLDGVLRQDTWDSYHNNFRDTNIWSKLVADLETPV